MTMPDPTQAGLAGLGAGDQTAPPSSYTYNPWGSLGADQGAGQSSANNPYGSTNGQGTGLFGWGAPQMMRGNVFGNNQSAAAVNQGALGMGAAMYGRTGPQIDTSGAAGYNGNYNQAVGSQNQAISLLQQTANGQGPALAAQQQAIQGQFNQQLGQQLNSQMAAANSARGGGPGLAAAQGNAAQQMGANTAQSSQAAGLAAAQARAQTMAAAQSAFGQQALGMGAQALQGQQQAYQLAGAQANLTAGQNALNQQGLLAEQGIGQGAELAQLQANENAYANQYGLAGTSSTNNSQAGAQAVGAGVGAGMAALGALA